MRIDTVFIAGPTATGKSKVAIELAKRINGEIISCDSIQVYEGMDIGTAKVKKREQEGIAHHLIDIVTPSQEYNVKHFKDDCMNKIQEIDRQNKIPIIAGGTGLYMSSVLFNYNMSDTKPDYSLRKTLEVKANLHGPIFLHEELKKYDPETAKSIDPNNQKRILRALEICMKSSSNPSRLKTKDSINPLLNPCIIGLNMNRRALHHRIEKRVDFMLEEGLIEEVRSLQDRYPNSKIAFEGIGYKEVISYLRGLCTFNEMRNRIIINTRQLAKRQISWFKRYSNIHWFCIDEVNENDLIDQIYQLIYQDFKRNPAIKGE